MNGSGLKRYKSNPTMKQIDDKCGKLLDSLLTNDTNCDKKGYNNSGTEAS